METIAVVHVAFVTSLVVDDVDAAVAVIAAVVVVAVAAVASHVANNVVAAVVVLVVATAVVVFADVVFSFSPEKLVFVFTVTQSSNLLPL